MSHSASTSILPATGGHTSASNVLDLLRHAHLRPTRQRLALARLLFTDVKRHVTAEQLHVEALAHEIKVSLATIYNSLHQFERAGLLRQLSIDGQSTVFDTNVAQHNHFFMEPDHRLIDIPGDMISVDGLPTPPEGWRVSSIDVVVRLKKA